MCTSVKRSLVHSLSVESIKSVSNCFRLKIKNNPPASRPHIRRASILSIHRLNHVSAFDVISMWFPGSLVYFYDPAVFNRIQQQKWLKLFDDIFEFLGISKLASFSHETFNQIVRFYESKHHVRLCFRCNSRGKQHSIVNVILIPSSKW